MFGSSMIFDQTHLVMSNGWSPRGCALQLSSGALYFESRDRCGYGSRDTCPDCGLDDDWECLCDCTPRPTSAPSATPTRPPTAAPTQQCTAIVVSTPSFRSTEGTRPESSSTDWSPGNQLGLTVTRCRDFRLHRRRSWKCDRTATSFAERPIQLSPTMRRRMRCRDDHSL